MCCSMQARWPSMTVATQAEGAGLPRGAPSIAALNRPAIDRFERVRACGSLAALGRWGQKRGLVVEQAPAVAAVVDLGRRADLLESLGPHAHEAGLAHAAVGQREELPLAALLQTAHGRDEGSRQLDLDPLALGVQLFDALPRAIGGGLVRRVLLVHEMAFGP